MSNTWATDDRLETDEGIMTPNKSPRGSAKLPDTYFELVRRHPLRSIQGVIKRQTFSKT